MDGQSLWICPACGANYPPSAEPPARCPPCEDERQWVAPAGQSWKTMDELAAAVYRSEVRPHEPGLVGVGVRPAVGVVRSDGFHRSGEKGAT
jgi:hypothetical protein